MKRSIWIALLLLFLYFLSYAGIHHSIDELATISVTESFLHGTWQVNRMEWEQERYPPQNAYGIDGNLYSKKGLGSPLVALPFLWPGRIWATVGAVQLTFLSTAILTALTGFLFYHLVVNLNYGKNLACLAALVLGTGTLLWPYSQMLFSEPIAAFGICLALLGMIQHKKNGRLRWLWVCSGGLAIVVLARSANAVVILPIIIALAAQIGADWRVSKNISGLLTSFLVFAAPLGSIVLIIILYNFIRFGTLFSYPLVPGEAFTTPLNVGVAGLLWSSGKGLIFYVPITGMIVLSYLVAWRQMRHPVYLAALGTIVVALIYYGSWYDWMGGKAWGPRFLVPLMPAIVLLALPAMSWLWQTGAPRWRRWLLVAWLAVSVAAQLPGVLINFEYQENLDGQAGATLEQMVWHWPYSPLLTYWDKVFTGSENPIWFHSFFWENDSWLLGLIFLLLSSIGLLHFRLAWQGWRKKHSMSVIPTLLLLTFFTGALGISLVIAAYDDPRWWEKTDTFATNQMVRTWLTEQGHADDIVLLDLQQGYDHNGRIWEWINYSSSQQPDYIGWQRRTNLTHGDQAHLKKWLEKYNRLFISLQATAYAAPESTTENWLRQWAYEGQNQWFDTQRVTEFLLPPVQPVEIASGQASWPADIDITATYTVRQGGKPEHILIDLQWNQSAPSAIAYSVQAISITGELLHQIDKPPAAHDRIGLILPETDSQLVLKLYNQVTGEVYREKGQLAEIVILPVRP